MGRVVTRDELIEMIVELEPTWREVFDDSPSSWSGEFLLSTYREELDKSIKREFKQMLSNFIHKVQEPTKGLHRSGCVNQLSLWGNAYV